MNSESCCGGGGGGGKATQHPKEGFIFGAKLSCTEASRARDAATAHSPKYYDVNLDSSVCKPLNVYSLLYLSVRFALSSAANALSQPASQSALFRFRFRAGVENFWITSGANSHRTIFTSRAADYGTELNRRGEQVSPFEIIGVIYSVVRRRRRLLCLEGVGKISEKKDETEAALVAPTSASRVIWKGIFRRYVI